MVLTRSTTKKIESADSAQVTVRDTLAEYPPGHCVPSLTKKRRRQGGTSYMAAPKKKWHEYQLTRNLDVLSLIATYISPGDLLNLARTCKSLRHLLMDKYSAFIWRAARRQFDGLPDCPADLSEPEYAYLAFHPCCHNCGEYAKQIFWGFRRRYCFGCRVKRLCTLSSFHDVIRNNRVLASEHARLNRTKWYDYFDKEQIESFMLEYLHSSNKKLFVEDKVALQATISTHADQCSKWEMKEETKRRDKQLMQMRERRDSIVQRIKQLGFEREVASLTSFQIEQFPGPLLNRYTPLTDEEWNQHLPKLLGIMDRLQSSRLESVVYAPRRQLLASEYAAYVNHPSPNTPASDIFPHAIDVASFPPFQDIKAPEETEINRDAFESAFSQMPELVGKWKEQLDVEITELVKIPSHLSTSGASQTAVDKLRLACAVFRANVNGLFTYPEVLSTSMTLDHRHAGPILGRYGIGYIMEAPYVIHACGLDPSVATPHDMDRRDTRLKCLSCDKPCVRNWRDAIWHAFVSYHRSGPDGYKIRWQVVSDEDTTAGVSLEELKPEVFRCLLCLPHVGDAKAGRNAMVSHLNMVHTVDPADVRQGEHYAVVGMAPAIESYNAWVNGNF